MHSSLFYSIFLLHATVVFFNMPTGEAKKKYPNKVTVSFVKYKKGGREEIK